MTDNTQDLDEILWSLTDSSAWDLIGINQEQANALSDQLSGDRAEAKQAILDWHNKNTIGLLDRLSVEVKRAYDKEGDFLEMAVDTIEAERNKLKESKDE